LEALKEAIRQEVAAITPEMILKVMDNYGERLHQCINIQGRLLSDILIKIHWCKTAFYLISGNRKKLFVSSLGLNLFASQLAEFFLPHPLFISLIIQLDAQNFCFTLSFFQSSTCFEHMCSSSGGQNCITQPLVSSHL